MQKYVRIGISLLAAALTIVRLPAQSAAPASIYSPYIFAWIGDGQRQSSDFLAVIDADRKGSRVLVTGDDQSYVLLVDVDPMTGNMTVDQRFTGAKTGGIGTGKVHSLRLPLGRPG